MRLNWQAAAWTSSGMGVEKKGSTSQELAKGADVEKKRAAWNGDEVERSVAADLLEEDKERECWSLDRREDEKKIKAC